MDVSPLTRSAWLLALSSDTLFSSWLAWSSRPETRVSFSVTLSSRVFCVMTSRSLTSLSSDVVPANFSVSCSTSDCFCDSYRQHQYRHWTLNTCTNPNIWLMHYHINSMNQSWMCHIICNAILTIWSIPTIWSWAATVYKSQSTTYDTAIL